MPHLVAPGRRRLPALLSSLPALLLLATPATAESFAERVDVELVDVEVRVLDRDGRPVPGLTREDFRVLEDGREQPITHFSAPGPRERAPTASSATAPIAPSPPPTGAAPVEPAPLPPDDLVVLVFDHNALRIGGRENVLRGVEASLGGAVRPESVMLAVQDGHGFRVLHTPRGSAETLARGLATVRELPPRGHELDLERRRAVDEIQQIWEYYNYLENKDGPGGGGLALEPACLEVQEVIRGSATRYSLEAEVRVDRSLDGLADLVAALGAVPGPKALLHVSDGLDLVAGGDLSRQLIEVCPEIAEALRADAAGRSLAHRYQQLATHAAANRVTIYPIEAGGTPRGLPSSIEDRGTRFATNALTGEEQRENRRAPLSFLADHTGGRAFFDRNRFADVLAEVRDDLAGVYSLAYVSPHPGDDRVHRIEVEVPGRRKLRIEHRRSYRAKPPAEQLADRVLGALTLGRDENPLGARLELAATEPLGAGRTAVDVAVVVPRAALSTMPGTGAALDLVLCARDADGGITRLRQRTIEIPADPESSDHRVVVRMEMRPGEHVVAAGLRPAGGGPTAVLAQRLLVPGTSDMG